MGRSGVRTIDWMFHRTVLRVDETVIGERRGGRLGISPNVRKRRLLVCAIVVFDMPVLVLTPRLTELVSTKHVFQAADLLESEYLV